MNFSLDLHQLFSNENFLSQFRVRYFFILILDHHPYLLHRMRLYRKGIIVENTIGKTLNVSLFRPKLLYEYVDIANKHEADLQSEYQVNEKRVESFFF